MHIRPASLAIFFVLACCGAVLAQTGAPVQSLPIYEAAGIMGRSVRGADGKDIGRIVDVIVDQVGQPRAAVIDFGGFLGVGNRRIAVEWSTLRFSPGNDADPVRLDLTPDQLKAAPEYKESLAHPPTIVSPPALPQGEKPSPVKPPPEKTTPEPADAGKVPAPAAPVLPDPGKP